MHDLIIRNAQIPRNDQTYAIDIGIRRQELGGAYHENLRYEAYVHDLGDLSTTHGYQEFDASEYDLSFGKTYPKILKDEQALAKLNMETLIKAGYTQIQFKRAPLGKNLDTIPMEIVMVPDTRETIQLGTNPTLLFIKNGEIKYRLHNGKLTAF